MLKWLRFSDWAALKSTKDDIQAILSKVKNDDHEVDEEEFQANDYKKKLDNNMLESFLNGFITFKRGRI